MTTREDGILFKITPSYNVTMHDVKGFDRAEISGTDVFLLLTNTDSIKRNTKTTRKRRGSPP